MSSPEVSRSLFDAPSEPCDTAGPSTSDSLLLTAAECQSPAGRGVKAGGHVRPKVSVHIMDPPVSEVRDYTVVKIEEKHGPMHRAIPVMPLGLAVVCCILNILLPGTGTLVSSVTVFCCGTTTRMAKPIQAFVVNVLAGLLQLASFIVIVGWIWSISWGMTFVQLAMAAKETNSRADIPYYVRRHSSVIEHVA